MYLDAKLLKSQRNRAYNCIFLQFRWYKDGYLLQFLSFRLHITDERMFLKTYSVKVDRNLQYH